LLRSPLLVVLFLPISSALFVVSFCHFIFLCTVVSVAFVGCTVLPHISSVFIFALWLFRSPLLVALFFRTFLPFLFLRRRYFGRLYWLHCFSVFYFCVVVSVAFVGCTVLPHTSSIFIFALWLFQSPLLVALFFCTFLPFFIFALWLFRSPLLVALFFRTFLPVLFCVVVVSVAFVGCTVLPHASSVFNFALWLFRSPLLVALFFRLLAFSFVLFGFIYFVSWHFNLLSLFGEAGFVSPAKFGQLFEKHGALPGHLSCKNIYTLLFSVPSAAPGCATFWESVVGRPAVGRPAVGRPA